MKCVFVLAGVIISSLALLGAASSSDANPSVAHFHFANFTHSQSQLRIAIVGLSAKLTVDSRVVETALAQLLGRDQRVSLVDASMIEPALKAFSYDGSINMSTGEARRLASAIGCDFFVIGKTEALTRSDREGESHDEVYAGIMFVDARSGSLVSFEFVSEKASTREAAMNGVVNKFNSRAAGYVDQLIQFRLSALTLPSKTSGDSSFNDFIEDIPDEASARARGFKPPQFLNRVKPDYTREAELADITATVEATVVFRSGGEVGNIEITRWAGFGLENSAMRAIRQLKFKSATRDGKPITVRATVRYNFRRIPVTLDN
jgi:TonB family protein